MAKLGPHPMQGWGGSPYPHCACGHPRGAHVRLGSNRSRDRDSGCVAVVGTGWCRCRQYESEL